MIPNEVVKQNSKASGEKGIALLMCIFALLLLTGLALSLMFMSDTEQAINTNYRDAERAYFAAMAGLQDARIQMRKNKISDPYPAWVPTTMPMATANTGVTYIVNPNSGTAVEPWKTTDPFMDRQLCNEGFVGLALASLGSNIPCATVPSGTYSQLGPNSKDPNRTTARAIDYRWVRITQKSNRSSAPIYVTGSDNVAFQNTPICWDGLKQLPLPAGPATCELVDPNPRAMTTVYRLTSYAVAPGRTQRTLQMDVAENPPIMTNAAVDSQDHVTLNGQLNVNGFDFCSCDTTDMSKCTKDPLTGLLQCPGATLKDGSKATCDNKKWAIYASDKIDPSNPSETLVAGHTPAYIDYQPWLFDIPAMIDSLKGTGVDVRKAPYNWTCTAPTMPGTNGSCGTQNGGLYGIPPAFPPSPVDDPLPDSKYGSCTNGVGAGCPNPQVTYVPGNVKLTANSTGNGILVIDGDLEINGGLQFYGLILVKGVVKFTGGGSEKTNIYGAVLAGKESYADLVLGGSASIQFNKCALKNAQKPQPPTTISFRELSY